MNEQILKKEIEEDDIFFEETLCDMENEQQIIVLVVEPEKEPYEKRIYNNLLALQEIVNGDIEIVYLPEPDCHIYCNDMGKLEGLPDNRRHYNGEVLCGTFVICAHDDEYNEISLNAEQLQRYQERFAEHEEDYIEENYFYDELSYFYDEEEIGEIWDGWDV